jgi:hypothetical protein
MVRAKLPAQRGDRRPRKGDAPVVAERVVDVLLLRRRRRLLRPIALVPPVALERALAVIVP